MAFNVGTVTVTFRGNIKPFASAVSTAQGRLTAFQKRVNAVQATLGAAARKAAFFSTIAAALITGKAMQETIQFRQEVAELAKLLGSAQAEPIAKSIQDLSHRLPVAQSELMDVAAAAARLGVRGRKNIQNFTQVIGEVGVATDAAAGEAADSMARIIKALGLPIDQTRNLSSTINALSNQMARSFSDIQDAVLRSAPALGRLGAEAPGVVALAASLAEVSSSSRRAGTRLRRLTQEMQMENNVEGLSSALDVTANQFRRMVDTSPVETIVQLAEAMKEGGEAALLIQQALGTAAQTAVAGLGQNFQTLTKQLVRAKKEFRETGSLAKELANFIDEPQQRIQDLINEARTAATEFGQGLLPALEAMIDALIPLARAFGTVSKAILNVIPDALQIATVATLTFTAAIGGLALALAGLRSVILSKVAPALGTLINSFFGIAPGSVAAATQGIMGLKLALGGLAGIIGLIGVGIAGAQFIGWLTQSAKEANRLATEIGGTENAIKQMDRLSEGLKVTVEELHQAIGEVVERQAAWAEQLNRTSGNMRQMRAEAQKLIDEGMVPEVTAGMLGGDAFPELTSQMDKFVEGLFATGEGIAEVPQEAMEIIAQLREDMRTATQMAKLLGDAWDDDSEKANLLFSAIEKLTPLLGAQNPIVQRLAEQYRFWKNQAEDLSVSLTAIENRMRKTAEAARGFSDDISIDLPTVAERDMRAPGERMKSSLERWKEGMRKFVLGLQPGKERIRRQIEELQALLAGDALKDIEGLSRDDVKAAIDALKQQLGIEMSRLERFVIREAQDIGKALGEGIGSGFEDMEDFLEKTLTSIIRAVTQAAIVKALKAGASVASVAGIGFAGSLLSGIFSGLLGSPKFQTFYWGQDLVTQMIEGIESQKAKLRRVSMDPFGLSATTPSMRLQGGLAATVDVRVAAPILSPQDDSTQQFLDDAIDVNVNRGGRSSQFRERF